MKKFIAYCLTFFSAIIIILLVCGIALYFRLPSIISDKLTQALQVPVLIEKIYGSLHNITIKSISVGNVPKSILPKAFSAETISVDTPLTNYTKDPIIIESITLDHVYLGLEFVSPSNLQSNWSAILNNIPPSTSTDSSANKTTIIKTLTIKNIRVELAYKSQNGKVQTLPLIDQIVLTNINTEEGLPMNQIMHTVLGEMLKSIFIKENLKGAVENLLNPQNTLQDLLSPIKGLFGA